MGPDSQLVAHVHVALPPCGYHSHCEFSCRAALPRRLISGLFCLLHGPFSFPPILTHRCTFIGNGGTGAFFSAAAARRRVRKAQVFSR